MALFFSRCSNFWRRHHVVVLAFLWCSSLCLGFGIAFQLGDDILSLMYTAVSCRASIVGMAVAVFLPVLLSAIAVWFSVPGFIFPVALIRGVSFGFSLAGVMIAFRSGGWLVFLLLTFSESLTLIPQLCLWFACLLDNRAAVFNSLNVCIISAIILCAFDYLCVSPFVLKLF